MRQITVKEECLNRGECRYGLRGVKVKVPGLQGEFYVRSSDWDREEELELVLNSRPEDLEPMTLDALMAIPEPPCLITGDALNIKAEEMASQAEEESLPAPEGDVTCPADRCFLRSYWPPVCCPPETLNEFNSQERAKAAGVPILPMP